MKKCNKCNKSISQKSEHPQKTQQGLKKVSVFTKTTTKKSSKITKI